VIYYVLANAVVLAHIASRDTNCSSGVPFVRNRFRRHRLHGCPT